MTSRCPRKSDARHSTYTYTYAGDGLRRSKTGPDGTVTTFTWDRSTSIPLLLTENINRPGTADDRVVRYIYGPDATATADITTTTSTGTDALRWYHHDQLGSTRALTGPTGGTIATLSYTPQGQPLATGPQITPMGWAGEYRDAETGFVYLRARYYDPATAQFLTRDPLELVTRSAYGYAGNNPVNFTDPSGLIGLPIHLPSLGDLWHGFADQIGCGFQQIAGVLGDGIDAIGRNLDTILLVGGTTAFIIGTMGTGAIALGALGSAELLAYGGALQVIATVGGVTATIGSVASECRCGSSRRCAEAVVIGSISTRYGFAKSVGVRLVSSIVGVANDWRMFATGDH